MTSLISSQRYNWMGYNGTESDEVDTALFRMDPNARGSNFDYEHRQEVIAEIKERLYLIKRDLDLIPEEELRAEEEARRQRREARRQREEEEARQREEEEARRREEEEARQREEEERLRQAEEERKRREAEAAAGAQPRRHMGDSDEDSDDDELNGLLTNMKRTQDQIDSAVKCFTAGTRVFLASRNQGYVSYLDGSYHNSLTKLDEYNSSHIASTKKAVHGKKNAVPPASEYQTSDLHTTLEARNEARKNLDARRVERDPTYAARLRKEERENMRTVPAEDGDEAELLKKLKEAQSHHEKMRTQYNKRAAATGKELATAAANRVSDGGATTETEEEEEEE